MQNDVTYDSFGAKDFSGLEAVDPVVRAILKFLEDRCVWSGTPSELLGALKNIAEPRAILPESSQDLYSHLVHHCDSFGRYGVDVVLGGGCPRVLLFRVLRDNTTTANPYTRQDSGLSSPPPATHNSESVTKTAGDAPGQNNSGKNGPEMPAPGAPNALDETPHMDARKLARAILTMSKMREQIAGSRAENDGPSGAASEPAEPVPRESTAASEEAFRHLPGATSASVELPAASAREELAIFNNVAQAYLGICDLENRILYQARDVSSMLALIAEEIQRISGADGVAVGLNRNGHRKSLALSGLAKDQPDLQRALGLIGQSSDPNLIQVESARAHTRANQLCSAFGIKSVFVSPFSVAGQLWGSLALFFRQTRRFERGDVLVIASVGDVLGNAIKNLRAA